MQSVLNQATAFLGKSYVGTKEVLAEMGSKVKSVMAPLFRRENYKFVEELLEKGKNYCQNNKTTVVVVLSVCAVVAVIVKTRPADKKKKKKSLKLQSTGKTFLIEDEHSEKSQEEKSTTTKNPGEESEMDKMKKRKTRQATRDLEIIDQSESDSGEEKIFFQMFRTYQES